MTTEEQTPSDAPIRASGETPAAEEAHEAHDQLDVPMDVAIDVERRAEVEARTPAFRRMRFNWFDRSEMDVMRNAHSAIDQRMVNSFTDAYQILDEIQMTVRIPIMVEPEMEPRRDTNGDIMWQRSPQGRIIEDYTRLTRKDIESYLGQITTRLFAWEQEAERMWMDALMAKAQFEERFSISYDELARSGSRTTVDDRRAAGSIGASEERYHAIFVTALSRRSTALVRSMERLGQRLKDILVA